MTLTCHFQYTAVALLYDLSELGLRPFRSARAPLAPVGVPGESVPGESALSDRGALCTWVVQSCIVGRPATRKAAHADAPLQRRGHSTHASSGCSTRLLRICLLPPPRPLQPHRNGGCRPLRALTARALHEPVANDTRSGARSSCARCVCYCTSPLAPGRGTGVFGHSAAAQRATYARLRGACS